MTERIDAPIAVLGAGSWGMALALLLARNGRQVYLWGRDKTIMQATAQQRRNPRYLSDLSLPDSLEPTADIAVAMSAVRDILVTVPSSAFRATLLNVKPLLAADARVLWATKGLEQGSYRLLHQVVAEVLGDTIPTAVISGPSFASEVAKGLPTAVTVASLDAGFANDIVRAFHSRTFRAYTSDDVIGVEAGGALKNVLAIAAGISDGLGFGANARSALVTRGLTEMMRLGVALGGRRETLMGLSGLGDLILTCTDNQSRNRRLGLALGQGKTLEQALRSIDQVVEGVQTAHEVYQLARLHGVDMPIADQVYAVLYANLAPRDAVSLLLERAQKPEVF
ncbi:MAG: NAD(P)-dependent glycerol-3-phosphate dehydrogenase [Gammaproteobacteria bacterium]|nr:NAD(P)-dependent glycerol-3-phosphate dehydrogenase [Gammaproteobacteria bacterium]